MAGMKQLGLKLPKPKVKTSARSIFKSSSLRSPGRTYKKSSLDGDPMKFGVFGYDINMTSPVLISKGKRIV